MESWTKVFLKKKQAYYLHWLRDYIRSFEFKTTNAWKRFLGFQQAVLGRKYLGLYEELVDEFRKDTLSIFSALGGFDYMQFKDWHRWGLVVDNKDKYIGLLPELMKIKEQWQGIIEIEIAEEIYEDEKTVVLKVHF